MTIERTEPWREPDGTPTTSGLHPHYALWDHENRVWDGPLPDVKVLMDVAERDALLAVAEEAATVAGLDSSFNEYDGTPVYPMLTAALARLAAIGDER